jgi:DNA-directed RNA polymerase sigma subunit (sigma70/sigma32)
MAPLSSWTYFPNQRRYQRPSIHGRNMEDAVMAYAAALPMLTAESGLTRYLQKARRFPMLEAQEEYMLAKRWREHGDQEAAHRLVTSHLRLVATIAMGYRGYGLHTSPVFAFQVLSADGKSYVASAG